MKFKKWCSEPFSISMPVCRMKPVLIVLVVLAASATGEETIVFNRDIRPILSDRCFQCHGPDAKQREADLRLDSAEGARADLGGYAAIVSNKLDESMLWERVTSDDPDLRMPPDDTGKPLSAEQIALLRRWIESGAEYQPHWSFMPLTLPMNPA